MIDEKIVYELSMMNKGLIEFLETSEFIIAGGYIRDLLIGIKPKDIDCFFINQEAYNLAVEAMEYKAKKIKQRKNSTVFKIRDGIEVDLVFSEKESFLQVIDAFDLHNCCAYFDGNKIVSSNKFLMSCEDKQLIINHVTFPYLTLGRIAKFKSRGWNIIDEQEKLILDYCYKAPWGANKEQEYMQ